MKIYIGRDVYDVDLTGVTDKQALVWDAASGKLKPSNNVLNADTVDGLHTDTEGTANSHVVATRSSGDILTNGAVIANGFKLMGNGQDLLSQGAWATRGSSFQSIPNATLTEVSFNYGNTSHQLASTWDGNTAFYATQYGWHLAFGSFELNNVSGRVRCWARVNGSRYYGQGSSYVGAANVGGVSICVPIYMNSGEYVQFQVFQESGGNRDLRYSDGTTNVHLCVGGLVRM